MTTDTISDMLTRIRNASLAKHKIVQIPVTKITRNLVKVLLAEGFIESFKEYMRHQIVPQGYQGNLYDSSCYLLVYLKFKDRGKECPFITKIIRASKPGLRLYKKSRKIPRILGGFGTAIVSTSKGLMTDKAAREEGVGGELLCYIW